MTSTYVNDLRLEEIANGEASGTWGTKTNVNLELIGEALGFGTRAIADASTDNITIADGASDNDRALFLVLTGGGQTCTVTLLPNTSSKVWVMKNSTSYALAFTQGSGANVSIAAGETKIIATNGGGSGAIVYELDGLSQVNATIGTATISTAVQLGHATDTTLTRISAGVVAVEGAVIKTVGKESIWVPAGAMYPSATNPCSDLTQVETTALRPDLKVLDFATGADEFAQFTVAFPKSWNEGTVTFQPFWTVTGTNTGTVAWQLGGIAVTSDATINTAFGTLVATTALAHSGSSNDLMVSVESGDVTIAGSPSTDDVCFFQINRDISADDQSGDARLIGIKLFFTTDAANDA